MPAGTGTIADAASYRRNVYAAPSGAGGIAMRMGMGGKRTPPNKAAGYGMIFVGAIIMLLAMPLFVWAAVIGALVAYVGHSLRGR